MSITGCPDDPSPPADGTTGDTTGGTVDPSTGATMSTGSTTTMTPTSDPTTGSTGEPETSESSSTGPASTSTGEVTCQPLPEFDEMPPMCPSDQALVNPPITCVVGATLAPGDSVSSCAAAPIPGSAYGFTANAPGTYVFTVIAVGFDPDPMIVVFDDMNNELSCSTDIGADLDPFDQAAAVAVDLMAAQSVRIVVQPEAVPVAPQPILLRVARQLDCGGDCCEADAGRMGCEFEQYAECVCTADESCCSGAWTEDCVGIARGLCLAGCGEF